MVCVDVRVDVIIITGVGACVGVSVCVFHSIFVCVCVYFYVDV